MITFVIPVIDKALDRSKLIPKKITVIGKKGKTYQTTKWIRPADIKEEKGQMQFKFEAEPQEKGKEGYEEQSKALFQEHLKKYMLYSQAQKRGFVRRVKDLFAKIDKEKDTKALMRLDNLATRLGIELERKGKISKQKYVIVPSPKEDYEKHGVQAKSFKTWFGDWENDPENASKIINPKTKEPQKTISKSINEKGEPIKVYHGTEKEFSSFDIKKVGTSHDSGYYGTGFYFTPSKEHAEYYGRNVKECYLNIENPFYLDMFDIFVEGYKEKNEIPLNKVLKMDPSYPGYDRIGQADIREYGSENFTKLLKENGYDGVVCRVQMKNDEPFEIHEIVAFESNQIKAVKNEGAFNPNSDNIYKSKFIIRLEKGKT